MIRRSVSAMKSMFSVPESIAMRAPDEQAYHSTGILRSAASASEALIRRHSGSARLPKPCVGSDNIANRVMPSGTRSV
ncbi:MAG: hypothetical protein BWY91_02212 [bacterium ADurb.BinA028]|nr:MAG: hypothetical protein BWY91_02212 [bacterium ADurb.BinA028]